MNKEIDNAIETIILNLPKLYEEDIEAELLDLKKIIKSHIQSQQDKLDKIAKIIDKHINSINAVGDYQNMMLNIERILQEDTNEKTDKG